VGMSSVGFGGLTSYSRYIGGAPHSSFFGIFGIALDVRQERWIF